MKHIKIWVLLGAILVVLGIVIFTVTACSQHSESGTHFGYNAEERITNITNDFEAIDIQSDTADIDFILTNDGSCRIIAVDHRKISYSSEVRDGALKILCIDGRAWYEKMFSFSRASLTVYLPKSEYSSLTVSEHTGKITVPSYFKFGNADLKLSTGDVHFYAATAESITVNGSTGNVVIEGANCGSASITVSTGNVTVSGGEFTGDIAVKVSTGDCIISNLSCKNLTSQGTTGSIRAENVTVSENTNIERSTGKTELCNLVCRDITSVADTGDLYMSSVIASGSLSIERSTGDVEFDGCDAGEIHVKTDTGSVEGTLLTDKIFIAKSSTGDIEVPETTSGGVCKIETSTGDIEISIGDKR